MEAPLASSAAAAHADNVLMLVKTNRSANGCPLTQFMHLGTDEGRFSLVIGFRLRLRRHAKGTCDFLFRTFTNEDLPDDPHAICQRREGCEPYILRVCSWHFPPSGNPRSTAVQFRRGVHGVSKNAALLSGLSSVTPQGCVVGCYPAVCSHQGT